MIPKRHATYHTSYEDRAALPYTSPLQVYLLHLIALKKTNLCVSADVSTTAELLSVAEEIGDSICILKTHADIIDDWGDRTVRGLREIARRKRFLIFEDRKFGDIGSTVQKQYTSGPLQIAKWAEITNAHIFPGPAIISSLKSAAQNTINTYNSTVSTEISGGTPSIDGGETFDDEYNDDIPADDHFSINPEAWTNGVGLPNGEGMGLSVDGASQRERRKPSVISLSTTIHTTTEPLSPAHVPTFGAFPEPTQSDALAKLQPTPYLRGLLLLAEMSSEGNLLTGTYTQQCLDMARQQPDFVLGFIAQRSLNSEAGDNFITMTPGVSLPPPGTEGDAWKGDGKGQQYNDPRYVVLEKGVDVIIVGRGILNAKDRQAEAERFRKAAWEAYEERVGQNRTKAS
ncbi:orotidine 5'-phosphate decarboxylase [Venturia nashicola]|nr:orotidine 5'-phosphate decarboxylase [Venturia nashicola]